MEKIKSLLAPKGFLFIEVPNCTDEYYLLDTEDAAHIHYFTKMSLTILLEKYGFNLITIDEYGLTSRESLDNNIDASIVLKGDESIKKNIPYKNGECLRALFQLTKV